MRTLATVSELLSSKVALVCVERRAACDGCHRATDDHGCSVCTLLGGNAKTVARARNTVGASVGDRVEVEARTARVLGYAAMVFLLPIVLLLVGYFVGQLLLGEQAALVFAAIGFLLSLLFVYFYSRLVVARRVDVEIVAVLSTDQSKSVG